MSPLLQKPRLFLGWTVVFAAAFVTFTQVALFNPVLGVFIPEFEAEFGWSRTEVSLAVAFGSLVSAGIAPFLGPMIDRHGGRIIVAGSATIMASCLVLLGLMQSVWQFFIVYAIGRGMAQGVSNLAVSVTVSKWFVRRRGFAIGVAMLGSRAGFAILPIGVQFVIDSSGWREAAFMLAATVAVFGILPTLAWLHPTPEAKGLRPDGDSVEDSQPGGKAAAASAEENWTSAAATRTRAFWLVTVALCLQFFAGGAVNLHQIPFMVDHGLSPQSAAVIISASAIFSALGTMLQGVLDLRLGTRRTLATGFVGCAIGMVILMSVRSMGVGLFFAAVYGTSFGLMVTSAQIVFAYYFGRQSLGAIRGRAQPFQMLFNAAGPIMGGLAYDLTGSYMAAFIPFGLGYLLGGVLLLIARKPSLPGSARPEPTPVA